MDLETKKTLGKPIFWDGKQKNLRKNQKSQNPKNQKKQYLGETWGPGLDLREYQKSGQKIKKTSREPKIWTDKQKTFEKTKNLDRQKKTIFRGDLRPGAGSLG